MCACVQMPEEGIRSPKSGVTGGCDPPEMGDGNQTQPLEEQPALLNISPAP